MGGREMKPKPRHRNDGGESRDVWFVTSAANDGAPIGRHRMANTRNKGRTPFWWRNKPSHLRTRALEKKLIEKRRRALTRSATRGVTFPRSLPSFYRVFFSFFGFRDRNAHPFLSTSFYRDLTEFDWVLPGFTGFYRFLHSFTEFYWILPSFTGFYLVVSSFHESSLVLLSFTGFYRVLLVLFLTWLYLVFMSLLWFI